MVVGESAAIRKVSDGGPADLAQGVRVAVLGQRGEDGRVAAQAVLVSPEGIQGFLGAGPGRGNAPRNRTGQ